MIIMQAAFWKKDKNEVNNFTLTILLTGIFLGLGLILFAGTVTFIRIDTVFNIFFICGSFIFIIHLPFLNKMHRYLAEIISYCYLGWGLIGTGIFMALNFYFHHEFRVDSYQVETAIVHPEEKELPFPVSVTIKGPGLEEMPGALNAETYEDFKYLLTFKGTNEIKYTDKPKIAIMATAKGLFGYRVLINKEIR